MSAPVPHPNHPRLSLFRCDHCARHFPAAPAEVRRHVRAGWPVCCGADMTLYVEAERPQPGATQVIVIPLALPGADPAADTAVLSNPLDRKPGE